MLNHDCSRREGSLRGLGHVALSKRIVHGRRDRPAPARCHTGPRLPPACTNCELVAGLTDAIRPAVADGGEQPASAIDGARADDARLGFYFAAMHVVAYGTKRTWPC